MAFICVYWIAYLIHDLNFNTITRKISSDKLLFVQKRRRRRGRRRWRWRRRRRQKDIDVICCQTKSVYSKVGVCVQGQIYTINGTVFIDINITKVLIFYLRAVSQYFSFLLWRWRWSSIVKISGFIQGKMSCILVYDISFSGGFWPHNCNVCD